MVAQYVRIDKIVKIEDAYKTNRWLLLLRCLSSKNKIIGNGLDWFQNN